MRADFWAVVGGGFRLHARQRGIPADMASVSMPDEAVADITDWISCDLCDFFFL